MIYVLKIVNSRGPLLLMSDDKIVISIDSRSKSITSKVVSTKILKTATNPKTMAIEPSPKGTYMENPTFTETETSSKSKTEKPSELQEIKTSKPQTAMVEILSKTMNKIPETTKEIKTTEKTFGPTTSKPKSTIRKKEQVMTTELKALHSSLIAFVIIFVGITVGYCYHKRKNGTIHYDIL